MAPLHLRSLGTLLAAGALATGCVQSYDGSNLQLDFSASTPLPSGNDPDGPTPPANTYMAFYGVDNDYKTDASGNVVVDANGQPVITASHLFEVKRFQLQPGINQTSPCFIEVTHTNFPGLHVTQVGAAVTKAICDRLSLPANCMDNPYAPPSGATAGDVTDVLDVQRRMNLLPLIQGGIKAVTSYSTFQYPTPIADCNFTGDQLPAITCTDPDSNKQRLRVCQAIWAANPDLYEGSDTVYTLPLNGHFYGAVEGHNPVNGSLIGGAAMFVDMVLSGFDAYAVNWQFMDRDGDGKPDYPAGFLTNHQASDIGYPFMVGVPVQRARGVISATLVSPLSSSTYVTMAAFPGLANDNVHF